MSSERERSRRKPRSRERMSAEPSSILHVARFRVGMMVLLALLGIGYFLKLRGCEKLPQEETEEPMRLADMLAPLIRSDFVLPETFKNLHRLKMQFYPLTRDISHWKHELTRVADIGFSNTSPEEKALLAEMIRELFQTDVFEKLAALRQENEKKVVKLTLIPIEHWNPNTGEMTETGLACAQNLQNILEVLSRFKYPKLFFEAIDVEGPVTEEKVLRSIGVSRKRYGKPNLPDEGAGFRALKQYYPWVFDSRFQVYGLEHKDFYDVFTRYQDRFEGGGVSTASARIFNFLFRDLLREQFGIEKTIAELQDGESGFVICGAAHMPTMFQYLYDQHPQVNHGLLVPRALVMR